MKKLFFILFFLPGIAKADSKLTALTSSSASLTDALYIVPTNVGASRQTTVDQVLKAGTTYFSSSGGGGASVNVSPHSVLFSTGGTTISGNTGLQYDDSVSSLSLSGEIGTSLFKTASSIMSFNFNPFRIRDAFGTSEFKARSNGTYGAIGYTVDSVSNGNTAFSINSNSDSSTEALNFTGQLGSFVSDANIFYLPNNRYIQTDRPWNFGSNGITVSTIVITSVLSASSLATDSSGNIIAGSAGGGGSSLYPATGSVTGIFYKYLYAGQAKLPGASSPFISNSTSELTTAIYFDDTSTQSVTFPSFRLSQYGGRPLFADIIFHSTATTGTVNWGVYTATMTPNVYSVSEDSPVYSVVVTTSVTVGAVANMPLKATVSLSNTTASNGDMITIKLEREAQSLDTAVGFGRVTEVDIYE